MKETKQAIKELSLMLMYLTRMEEKNPFGGDPFVSAWKGYDFDVLNQLEEEELIDQGRRPSKRKSVDIRGEGVAKAKELLNEYGIKDWGE